MRNFLNSESSAHFCDDEPFYHINIKLFSITVSAATVTKATNITCLTPSLIHITQELTIQSSALKLVQLSYLNGNVDRKNV